MRLRFSIVGILAVTGVIAVALSSYRLGYQSGAKTVGSSDLMDAAVLDLAELESIAGNRALYYQGSNQQFHYVRVEDRDYFRLRRSEVTIPSHGVKGDGAGSLGFIWMMLRIEDGRLMASDAPSGGFH